MTIKKKVHKWTYVQSDMIERKDLLFAAFWQKTSDVSTFKIFYLVAVGSFTADGGLVQPTESVKTTPHKSIFAVWISTRNSRTGQKSEWQQVNSEHKATGPTTCGMTWSLWKLTSTSTNDSWTLWIEPQLSLLVFRFSSLLLVSASLDCLSLFRWSHIALAQGSSSYSSHFHAHVPRVISLCVFWLTRLIH